MSPTIYAHFTTCGPYYGSSAAFWSFDGTDYNEIFFWWIDEAGVLAVTDSANRYACVWCGAINAHVPFTVEFKITLGAQGYVEMRTNGNTVWQYSGDFSSWGSSVAAIASAPGALNRGAMFDNIVVWDDQGDVMNDWLGELELVELLAESPGTFSELDVNAGTHLDAIDDMTLDDTAYLEGDANERDTFAVTIPSGDYQIYGVEVATGARRTNSLGGEVLGSTGLVSNGVEHWSDPVLLYESYAMTKRYYTVDPTDNSPWTKEKLESLEIGFKGG